MDAFRDYPTIKEANLCTMLVCICPTVEVDDTLFLEAYVPIVTVRTPRNFKSRYVLPCPLREEEVLALIQHERNCKR